jgi:hypothetical protein
MKRFGRTIAVLLSALLVVQSFPLVAAAAPVSRPTTSAINRPAVHTDYEKVTYRGPNLGGLPYFYDHELHNPLTDAYLNLLKSKEPTADLLLPMADKKSYVYVMDYQDYFKMAGSYAIGAGPKGVQKVRLRAVCNTAEMIKEGNRIGGVNGLDPSQTAICISDFLPDINSIKSVVRKASEITDGHYYLALEQHRVNPSYFTDRGCENISRYYKSPGNDIVFFTYTWMLSGKTGNVYMLDEGAFLFDFEAKRFTPYINFVMDAELYRVFDTTDAELVSFHYLVRLDTLEMLGIALSTVKPAELPETDLPKADEKVKVDVPPPVIGGVQTTPLPKADVKVKVNVENPALGEGEKTAPQATTPDIDWALAQYHPGNFESLGQASATAGDLMNPSGKNAGLPVILMTKEEKKVLELVFKDDGKTEGMTDDELNALIKKIVDELNSQDSKNNNNYGTYNPSREDLDAFQDSMSKTLEELYKQNESGLATDQMKIDFIESLTQDFPDWSNYIVVEPSMINDYDWMVTYPLWAEILNDLCWMLCEIPALKTFFGWLFGVNETTGMARYTLSNRFGSYYEFVNDRWIPVSPKW